MRLRKDEVVSSIARVAEGEGESGGEEDGGRSDAHVGIGCRKR